MPSERAPVRRSRPMNRTSFDEKLGQGERPTVCNGNDADGPAEHTDRTLASGAAGAVRNA